MALATVTLGRSSACGDLIRRYGSEAWVQDGSRVYRGRIVTNERAPWLFIVGITGGFPHEAEDQ